MESFYLLSIWGRKIKRIYFYKLNLSKFSGIYKHDKIEGENWDRILTRA